MPVPIRSGRFKKDVKRLQKRAYDMEKLKEAILLLSRGGSIPAAYNDHPLKGDWQGYRDLHIAPDWVLIYRVKGNDLELARTGTHSDLFNE